MNAIGIESEGEACLKIVTRAAGTVGYSPRRAPAALGWGPFEVHPQRVACVINGSSRLVYEGEWLVLPPEGEKIVIGGVPLESLVCTMAGGGRAHAELLAVAWNEDRAPGSRTRIVNLDGTDRASAHTRETVLAAVQTMMAANR